MLQSLFVSPLIDFVWSAVLSECGGPQRGDRHCDRSGKEKLFNQVQEEYFKFQRESHR
jgi:hypothetical protein